MTLELWQFLTGVVFTVGGAVISAVWAVGSIKSAIREHDTRIKILEGYKKESEISKDLALQTLAEIKGLLQGIQRDISEVKREYRDLRKDFDSYKDATNTSIRDFYRNNHNTQ